MGNCCAKDNTKANSLSEPMNPVGASPASPSSSPSAATAPLHPAQEASPPRSFNYTDCKSISEEPFTPSQNAIFDKMCAARAQLRTLGRAKNAAAEIEKQVNEIRGLIKELHDEFRNGEIRCVLVARCLGPMGHTLISVGKVDEGIALQRRALEEHRYLHKGKDHPDLATALDRVGVSLLNAGHRRDACGYLNQALDMRRRIYDNKDNVDFAQSLNAVGIALESIGQEADGVALQKEGLEMYRRLHGAHKEADELDELSQIMSPRKNRSNAGSGVTAPTPTKTAGNGMGARQSSAPTTAVVPMVQGGAVEVTNVSVSQQEHDDL